MATRILQVLAGEVQERKAQRCDPDMPLFRENEMLIFVGMSLGRLLRPFEYFMEVLLDWHKLRGHVDLEGVTMTLVSCRQPNDTTGPTFKYALLARHQRERRPSAYVSGIGESQITGIQTNPCTCNWHGLPMKPSCTCTIFRAAHRGIKWTPRMFLCNGRNASRS